MFYGTGSEFEAWALERGLELPSTVDPETALIRATDYIEERYRGRWKGVRATEAQVLAWPRIAKIGSSCGVLDQDGYEVDPTVVPLRVEHATYEAARRIAAGTELQPDLARGGQLRRLKNIVEGAIEQEQEWFQGASARTTITAIDGLLRGLVIAGNVAPVLRA